ncbi:MAG: polysaccharide pyruvyl transferase family protein [Patescibacteria group bacterium]
MIKLTIVGVTFSGNKGAAGMLESTIQNLSSRLGDVYFSVLSISPREDKDLNRYDTVSIFNSKPLYLACVIVPAAFIYRILPLQPIQSMIERFVPEIKEINSSQAVLDEGGITFSDGRELFLLFNIATILPGLLLGKKVIKVAQALGPFNNPINRLAAKIFLPRMHLIIARGEKTMNYLKALGLTNLVQGVDIAFALNNSEVNNNKLEKYIPEGKKQLVGISPSVIINNNLKKEGRDYIKILRTIINELTEKNYNIIIVPHSVRRNTLKEHNNDLPLSKELYRQLEANPSVTFVDAELSAQELRFIIGKCDIFISSRFHAMVSSLKMGVPTIVLGWSHKYAEVLALFDIEKYALPYKQITFESVMTLFDEIIANKETIHKKITERLPPVIFQAQSSFEYIIKIINKDTS